MAVTRKTILRVYARLRAYYGDPPATHPRGKPLDVLVETILSQHTSDRNSHRAYRELRRAFPSWEDVLKAAPRDIEEAIRSGGLARQKSVRIKRVLAMIQEREGRISLARLRRLATEEGYAYLTSLPGVGDKTACCVLLFALNRPVMPVDTHIHRIVRRLGWIRAKDPPEAARTVLEKYLPSNDIYHAHVLLIAHGRQICIARRPACERCPIRRSCPTGQAT